MDQSLTIGPFAFPAVLPLALLAFFLAGFAARRVERRLGTQVEHHLFWMLLAAGLAARLAFVLQYRESYLRAPLSALDVRDGGWNLFAAAGVAFVYAIALALRNRALRKPLAAAILTGAAVWTAGALLLTATAPERDRLPALSLPALDGSDVSLARLAGKPTVVNLWATWCPPCLREMPVLQQAQAERGDVQFVFLNQGESAGRVRDFLATRQLRLHNVLLDEAGEMGRLTGHRALPTTLFYDAQGRLVATRIGELSHATLTERLAAISPQAAGAPASGTAP
jgi:thiol-disulfide isomerase/thioredoxin